MALENPTVDQRYEKIRKAASWLKSKIISTDYAIQKYQGIRDIYNESEKAHTSTRIQLKDACLSYKSAAEMSTALENQNRMLLANQEVLKGKALNIQNKYDALVSHTNQLQMLVKQLENEKDALVVEKELDKCSNKQSIKDIAVLQREKDAMLNDLIKLKDVILGKKKRSKKHVNLLKKYVKDIKSKGPKNLCTSEESDDDMDNYGNKSLHAQKSLNEIHNDTDKELNSCTEQNYTDNYSDGEVSVDTGRGSSRANSHDKYLSSPDYTAALENILKIPGKKQIDAANSPITVYPPVSVATSPIVFDHVPLSEEINVLVEKEKLSDCSSPSPDLSKFIDMDTNSVQSDDYVIVEKPASRCSEKSSFIDPGECNKFDQGSTIEKQISMSKSEEFDTLLINYSKKFIDACTSPLPLLPGPIKCVDIGVGTDVYDESVNLAKTSKFGNPTSGHFVKITEDVMLSKQKRYVNACTSPITKSYSGFKCVHKGTNTDSNMVNEIQMLEKSVNCTNNIRLTEKSKKNLTDQEELPINDGQISRGLNKKIKDNTIKDTTEQLRVQEKVCLESNSSKRLSFESNNDVEVQNILNVMKLHHDLISPISQTPCDSHYLKLIPEMNYTLTKIWSTLSNIYKMPNQLRIRDPRSLNSVEIDDDLSEIFEVEITNNKQNADQQPPADVRTVNQDVEDDKLDTTEGTYMETSITSTDIASEYQNIISDDDSTVIKSKINKNHTVTNKLLPRSSTDKVIITAEKDKREIANSVDFNEILENVICNTNNTDENILMTKDDNNKETEDSHQSCIVNFSELSEICDDTNNSRIHNNETCSTIETPITHTIIINGTKSKKKSKLDKFRDKLLPTCKIKKMTPSITKYPSKVCIKSKDTTISPSLNQKIAYDNAVKVMAEFRSNQELQDKKKSLKPVIGDTNLRSDSNKTESSTSEMFEQNMLSTRSRTRRVSKREDTVTVVTENLEQNIRAIEKSPVTRNSRKRRADMEVDSLQSNCKRILRSSNVRVPNENNFPIVRNDNIADELHKNLETNSECKGYMSSSDNLLSKNSKSVKDNNPDNNVNLQNHDSDSQNELTGAAESDITFEKSVTKKLKPVIELSKCLANNANLVSIVPGNVGYLNISKNINNLNKSEARSDNHVGGNQNRGIEIGSTAINQDPVGKVGDFSNISGHSNNDQNGNISEHITEQNSPRKSTEESLHAKHSDITNTEQNITKSMQLKVLAEASTGMKNPVVKLIPIDNEEIVKKYKSISYSDLDLFTVETNIEHETPEHTSRKSRQGRNETNILCSALDRYGVISVKYVAKKVPDEITLKICQYIVESIPKIVGSSKTDQKNKMDDLVNNIQIFETKHILAGFMKYLKDPMRKIEMFNKIVYGAAPSMTKAEVILLYVIEKLNGPLHPGFINRLWNNMEHALFQLNRTPDFEVIESISHFYAILCRYFRNKSRLRCFMLDAMYCLQFKAIPLIKQCLEVCPGVLPNANDRMAKTSLVTCLVYLLHFYKCKDKFNRAQDIRNILYRRYHYRFSEWNETMILEIFRKAIMDLRGTQNDKKMLRVALIILCKRHGAKWCQLNIIQNILLPIIEKKDVPERIKQFCVLMLGPLLKPFPADRKAQCEIVINQLLQMLQQNTSHEMKEAIYSSLIFMNKHDQERVVQALLSWNPTTVSPEFEEILNDYVMEKPLATWKKLVANHPSQLS